MSKFLKLYTAQDMNYRNKGCFSYYIGTIWARYENLNFDYIAPLLCKSVIMGMIVEKKHWELSIQKESNSSIVRSLAKENLLRCPLEPQSFVLFLFLKTTYFHCKKVQQPKNLVRGLDK